MKTCILFAVALALVAKGAPTPQDTGSDGAAEVPADFTCKDETTYWQQGQPQSCGEGTKCGPVKDGNPCVSSVIFCPRPRGVNADSLKQHRL